MTKNGFPFEFNGVIHNNKKGLEACQCFVCKQLIDEDAVRCEDHACDGLFHTSCVSTYCSRCNCGKPVHSDHRTLLFVKTICDMIDAKCNVEGCNFQAKIIDTLKHRKHCPYEMTRCDHCLKTVKKVELEIHKTNICEHRVVRCVNSHLGCNERMEYQDMPVHFCDYALAARLISEKDEQIFALTETLKRKEETITLLKEEITRTKLISPKKEEASPGERKKGRKRGKTFKTHLKDVSKQLQHENQKLVFQTYSYLVTLTDPTKISKRVLSDSLRELPSREEFGIFYQMVPDPICLHDIENKIIENKYESVDDFEKDIIKLRDDMCKVFGPESPMFRDASMLVDKLKEASATDDDTKSVSLRKRKRTEK
jgi:hypothetical protein